MMMVLIARLIFIKIQKINEIDKIYRADKIFKIDKIYNINKIFKVDKTKSSQKKSLKLIEIK